MLELVVFDVDGLMLDTESVWKEAFDQAGDKYGIQNMGSTLFPKLDFLDAHHIKKAVATTTRRELTEERLKRVGVYDRFDYVLCGDEVINRKPDPEIYLSVLKKMDTDARNALVLEDSVVGVEAAYRAGIDCIQVPDIIAPTDVQKKQTVYTAKDLMEARDYIKENRV